MLLFAAMLSSKTMTQEILSHCSTYKYSRRDNDSVFAAVWYLPHQQCFLFSSLFALFQTRAFQQTIKMAVPLLEEGLFLYF